MRKLRTVACWFMSCCLMLTLTLTLTFTLSLTLVASVDARGLPGGEDSGHTKSQGPEKIQTDRFNFSSARIQEEEQFSQCSIQELETENEKVVIQQRNGVKAKIVSFHCGGERYYAFVFHKNSRLDVWKMAKNYHFFFFHSIFETEENIILIFN